jgi:glycosyltransferase involved in cell wall biosynthesis
MSTRDGVSIVVPNWNHEVFLPRSVASGLRGVEALARRGVPAEVVVVDDFSRDGSSQLLRQLEALHHARGLRVVARAANRGLAAARNFGLAEAAHRYVVFMDADNELVPETLPIFRQSLLNTAAAAAYGNLLVRGMNAPAAHGVLSNQSFQRGIFRGNYVDAFAMFDRVQVEDAGRYDASCAAHEDYELWLHLAATGRRILFVPAAFGYYYENAGSMINREQADHNAGVHRRVKRIFDQVGARSGLPLRTDCLRYHPDLGYL